MARFTPFLLSLPERVLRSATALAAGLVREIGEVTIPQSVRRGQLYKNLVDATLRFLIEQVGGVEGVYPSEERLTEDFLLRRTAGNGIELIGILAFRASPVWVLAALADASGGGRYLIKEIAGALKPIDERALPPRAGIVYAQLDAAASVRLALQLFPSTRTVLVVGGTSPFDRSWQPQIRNDLKQLSAKVAIEYDFDSALVDLVRKVAMLPEGSVVLFTSLTRDGAAVPQRPVDALEALNAATRVPIFGLASTQLGHGIVGGALLDL